MSVVFRPANAGWIQAARPEWSVNGWDVDEARVTWRGPAPGKKGFEDQLIKFASMPPCFASGDPAYPQMWLKSWANGGGTVNFPAVDLSFLGFRGGTIPIPKNVNSNSAQVAQGAGRDSFGDVVSATIKYIASRTVWTWFETAIPELSPPPPYNTVDQAINPINTIYGFSITGATSSGSYSNLIPYSALVAVLNSLVLERVVTDYDREPLIPVKLYACRSTVEYKFSG